MREQSEFRGVREMVRKGGFILIEFLVVVVFLIILVVVVPRIAGAALETKSSALATDLPIVRPKIELYKLDHNDQLPAAIGEIDGIYPKRLGRVFKIQTQPGRDKI
jgi:competence protein ComGC